MLNYLFAKFCFSFEFGSLILVLIGIWVVVQQYAPATLELGLLCEKVAFRRRPDTYTGVWTTGMQLQQLIAQTFFFGKHHNMKVKFTTCLVQLVLFYIMLRDLSRPFYSYSMLHKTWTLIQ